MIIGLILLPAIIVFGPIIGAIVYLFSSMELPQGDYAIGVPPMAIFTIRTSYHIVNDCCPNDMPTCAKVTLAFLFCVCVSIPLVLILTALVILVGVIVYLIPCEIIGTLYTLRLIYN